MKIYASRASVAAGDDIEAPHGRKFSFREGTPLEEALASIQRLGYLPQIAGGHATWSVTSNAPVAVLAQQWSEPKMFFCIPEKLDTKDGTLRLHFNYHAQVDPQTVYDVLWGFQIHAI